LSRHFVASAGAFEAFLSFQKLSKLLIYKNLKKMTTTPISYKIELIQRADAEAGQGLR
jgi:hypothetical protein